MPGTDWLYQFTNNLTALTTANGGALTSFGLTLLSFIAFMQLAKMVINFSTANMSFSFNPAPLEGGEIVKFMLRLGFCCILETYWINPLPGASWGFNKLFSAIAQEIVKVLDQNTQAQLTSVIQEAWQKTGPPSLISPLEIFEYVYVQVLMGVAAAIIFVINVSSFIFYAVTALFGPLFIPLYMTDTFRGKFLHFIDVLVSFAMIRAVAAAFIFVWSGFYTTFLQQTFNGDYSIGMWIANILPVTMVFVAFIINMLFIPTITQAVFGGAAGTTASAQQTVMRLIPFIKGR
ncbi:type IV secretion system protein [Terriglobus aquaticus]|uniref:Type IV secretion system protein n=1 Tax=Terriglobus aquaticus TaxID=940139 RepID=A0ABW9KP53_9BACT